MKMMTIMPTATTTTERRRHHRNNDDDTMVEVVEPFERSLRVRIFPIYYSVIRCRDIELNS